MTKPGIWKNKGLYLVKDLHQEINKTFYVTFPTNQDTSYSLWKGTDILNTKT